MCTLAVGTNVYGAIFFISAVIVFVVIGRPIYSMWRRFVHRMKEATERHTTPPDPVWVITVTLFFGGVYIAGLTYGWNALQDITTSMSHYKTPAEIQEEKRVDATPTPTADEIDARRTDQKNRAEKKPHETALESFDEAMRREAERIKQRSSATQPAVTPKN